jgi:hypothetical protein
MSESSDTKYGYAHSIKCGRLNHERYLGESQNKSATVAYSNDSNSQR